MSYVVRCVRETGTITYHCLSASSALEKVKDFRQAEYRDITITGTNDLRVSGCTLVALLSGEVTGQTPRSSWAA